MSVFSFYNEKRTVSRMSILYKEKSTEKQIEIWESTHGSQAIGSCLSESISDIIGHGVNYKRKDTPPQFEEDLTAIYRMYRNDDNTKRLNGEVFNTIEKDAQIMAIAITNYTKKPNERFAVHKRPVIDHGGRGDIACPPEIMLNQCNKKHLHTINSFYSN